MHTCGLIHHEGIFLGPPHVASCQVPSHTTASVFEPATVKLINCSLQSTRSFSSIHMHLPTPSESGRSSSATSGYRSHSTDSADHGRTLLVP